MLTLSGRVTLVTGGSQGVGRGIALALAEAGATVYATSRSGRDTPENAAHATVPGAIVDLRCDHRHDEQVEAVFQQLLGRESRLDLLVNNVWGGYAGMVEDSVYTWERPFWEQPLWR